MCKDALHLIYAFRHCLTIGLPQVRRVYARGNRFAASARTHRAPGRGRELGPSMSPCTERAASRPASCAGACSMSPSSQALLVRASPGHASAHGFAEHAPMHGTSGASGKTVRGGMPGAAARRPRQTKKAPPGRGHACREEPARRYWMRVRQYGHTFQSALSGRWQVGQTFLTCVLQMGHTTKSRSMGAPHLGQMP